MVHINTSYMYLHHECAFCTYIHTYIQYSTVHTYVHCTYVYTYVHVCMRVYVHNIHTYVCTFMRVNFAAIYIYTPNAGDATDDVVLG